MTEVLNVDVRNEIRNKRIIVFKDVITGTNRNENFIRIKTEKTLPIFWIERYYLTPQAKDRLDSLLKVGSEKLLYYVNCKQKGNKYKVIVKIEDEWLYMTEITLFDVISELFGTLTSTKKVD
eukprot:TRINITY_DN5643_c1_g1_i1.p1 TRINITY_DN5643_c1_g1~~TRINITY_DN5643_c1_g1_i1.p1  ORF type:complete len:122 (-),score=13.90 TRINITY_DN5643_c1_g1_i1:100-465(-)